MGFYLLEEGELLFEADQGLAEVSMLEMEGGKLLKGSEICRVVFWENSFYSLLLLMAAFDSLLEVLGLLVECS